LQRDQDVSRVGNPTHDFNEQEQASFDACSCLWIEEIASLQDCRCAAFAIEREIAAPQ
jgi:hypothetical protein